MFIRVGRKRGGWHVYFGEEIIKARRKKSRQPSEPKRQKRRRKLHLIRIDQMREALPSREPTAQPPKDSLHVSLPLKIMAPP